MAKTPEVPHLRETRTGWELIHPGQPKRKRRRWRRRAVLALIAAATVVAIAFVVDRSSVVRGALHQPNGIATCDEFQKVQVGGTLDDVNDIVGGHPSDSFGLEGRNFGSSTYGWAGARAGTGLIVTLDRDGFVSTKSQLDLC
jgi:hypothetical protein